MLVAVFQPHSDIIQLVLKLAVLSFLHQELIIEHILLELEVFIVNLEQNILIILVLELIVVFDDGLDELVPGCLKKMSHFLEVINSMVVFVLVVVNFLGKVLVLVSVLADLLLKLL